jgi:hypothetical protein
MSQESVHILNELNQIEKDDDLLRSFVDRWDRNLAKFQTLPAINRANLSVSRTFQVPYYIIKINILHPANCLHVVNQLII